MLSLPKVITEINYNVRIMRYYICISSYEGERLSSRVWGEQSEHSLFLTFLFVIGVSST